MKDLRRLGRIAGQRLFLTRPGLKSPDKQVATCKPGNVYPIPARSAFAFARREKCLNALFASSLCIGLVFWIYDQKDWLLQGEWRSNYGVTEWMINYQGGFLRRGLPGELIFFIGKQTGLDIGWFVLCFSIHDLMRSPARAVNLSFIGDHHDSDCRKFLCWPCRGS
jgi:hypothetical protein